MNVNGVPGGKGGIPNPGALAANPTPGITVKDKALRDAYREAYTAAAGKYALSAPFMERFFNLAREGGFALITGDPGTGKSVALRLLAERLVVDARRRWWPGAPQLLRRHTDFSARIFGAGAEEAG